MPSRAGWSKLSERRLAGVGILFQMTNQTASLRGLQCKTRTTAERDLMAKTPMSHVRSRVLAVVAAIPEGRVTTYGSIGRRVHVGARQVAFILASLTAEEAAILPWFRVVGVSGVVSSTKRGAVGRRQIARLRADGVTVSSRNKVEDFSILVWSPAWSGGPGVPMSSSRA
jgi:methylated-DNA-protein-cysteine methyltransferase related protein